MVVDATLSTVLMAHPASHPVLTLFEAHARLSGSNPACYLPRRRLISNPLLNCRWKREYRLGGEPGSVKLGLS